MNSYADMEAIKEHGETKEFGAIEKDTQGGGPCSSTYAG
jgi:hypothetical protein